MKITKLLEISSIVYSVGDIVETPFGPGVIMKQLGGSDGEEYYSVILDDKAQQRSGLKNKPYKFAASKLGQVLERPEKYENPAFD